MRFVAEYRKIGIAFYYFFYIIGIEYAKEPQIFPDRFLLSSRIPAVYHVNSGNASCGFLQFIVQILTMHHADPGNILCGLQQCIMQIPAVHLTEFGNSSYRFKRKELRLWPTKQY